MLEREGKRKGETQRGVERKGVEKRGEERSLLLRFLLYVRSHQLFERGVRTTPTIELLDSLES